MFALKGQHCCLHGNTCDVERAKSEAEGGCFFVKRRHERKRKIPSPPPPPRARLRLVWDASPTCEHGKGMAHRALLFTGATLPPPLLRSAHPRLGQMIDSHFIF